MIQPLQITQNDYGYQLPFTLQDGTGNAVNLTGATLSFKLQSAQDPDRALVSLGGSMSIDSGATGTCHFTPASGDFPNPGKFLASITATWSSTEVLTWSGIPITVLPALPEVNN
jgi:hypothetical protein